MSGKNAMGQGLRWVEHSETHPIKKAGWVRRPGAPPALLSLPLVWAGMAQVALAQGALRDLPDYYGPGKMLTVSIAIDAPAGTILVVLEDSPPTGWTAIGTISDGGEYDEQNHKVKWGPFFDNLSRTVTYEVTPPGKAAEEPCFTGSVSFDGEPGQPIVGDQCIAVVVPTLSGWGLLVMGLLVLTAGTIAAGARFESRTSRS